MINILMNRKELIPLVLYTFTDRFRYILNLYNKVNHYYNDENEQIFKIDDNYRLCIKQMIESLHALEEDLSMYRCELEKEKGEEHDQ